MCFSNAEINSTKTYVSVQSSEEELVSPHISKCSKFKLRVEDTQRKLPVIYWIPKLHKESYKARFIANSSACTTTNISILLASCLTAIKEHVRKYCDKAYEDSGIHLFWSIKNSGDILNKISNRSAASSLSTFDFSTLYTTLPHNLMKDKLNALIRKTFSKENTRF